MKRGRIGEVYALHTPTNPKRKGSQDLLDMFSDKGNIPLYILSGMSRTDILKWKAKASFFIDMLGTYDHGPYGMNSVECWYLKVPVWTKVDLMNRVMVPELSRLVHTLNINTLAKEINNYEPDKKQLNYARAYAIKTHDPMTIAQQYVSLGEHLIEGRIWVAEEAEQ